MSEREKLAMRSVAVVMVVAALAMGFAIWSQAQAMDDGGPPMGAICLAVPVIGLLIGAGAIWTRTTRDNR